MLVEEEVEQKGEEKWRVYQSLGRSASVHVPTSLSGRGEEVSVDEIRSASIHSHPYYPPSLHGALVSSPEPDAPPYAYGLDFSLSLSLFFQIFGFAGGLFAFASIVLKN